MKTTANKGDSVNNYVDWTNMFRAFASDIATLTGEELDGMTVRIDAPDGVTIQLDEGTCNTLDRIADALDRLVDHVCGGEIADVIPPANKEVSDASGI